MAASEPKLQSVQSHLFTNIFILSMYLYMDLEFFFLGDMIRSLRIIILFDPS